MIVDRCDRLEKCWRKVVLGDGRAARAHGPLSCNFSPLNKFHTARDHYSAMYSTLVEQIHTCHTLRFSLQCLHTIPSEHFHPVGVTVYVMSTPSILESLYPYPDNIVIQDRLSAIQYGHNIFEQGMIERCLVLWVDGSVEKFPPVKEAKRLTAAAVRYLDFSSKDWAELITFNTLPYGSAFALEAEMIAIHEAFRKACELTNDFDRVLIFTDCQSILQGIKSKSTFSFLSKPDWIMNLFTYANMLYDVGITVELRWVPAHSAVEGNERVDELAKRFRRAARSILAKEQPDLILRHVTIITTSEELLRQDLFQKAQLQSEEQNLQFSHQILEVNDSQQSTKRKNSMLLTGSANLPIHPRHRCKRKRTLTGWIGTENRVCTLGGYEEDKKS
ncbi:uncharacterized protein BDR25DRAFT_354751 [Lindgomyces ingoldianus]|uniref:Uncharacterized protein n=1 Tax=Lindgomyces ingoldianus TaxID=673940 RepID=A0ACB6QXN3_9PLEO|nr:uncharacterized protein BDR25DRAFT_354751 [Lindgomyces ingoldianus]KAF2470842.1 hypothetical protein BDR25DRAFT_354751 [Lindgomyces ingoldianus]